MQSADVLAQPSVVVSEPAVPATNILPLPMMSATKAADGAKRNVRLEIMAKLHPHLLRSRREDLGVRDDEDGSSFTAKTAKREGNEGTAAEEEAEEKIRSADRSAAAETAAWVVDSLVEAATRRSPSLGGCVSSDKSTDGHA